MWATVAVLEEAIGQLPCFAQYIFTDITGTLLAVRDMVLGLRELSVWWVTVNIQPHKLYMIVHGTPV